MAEVVDIKGKELQHSTDWPEQVDGQLVRNDKDIDYLYQCHLATQACLEAAFIEIVHLKYKVNTPWYRRLYDLFHK